MKYFKMSSKNGDFGLWEGVGYGYVLLTHLCYASRKGGADLLRKSVMILFPRNNGESAVNLFKEDGPNHLVREGHA